jgi:hypothetical protein
MSAPALGRAERRARQAADHGDLPAALSLIDRALTQRRQSTDRAWNELSDYRDALSARQIAAGRIRPTRRYRAGHSAPANRPTRRRFTPPLRRTDPRHDTTDVSTAT